MELDLPAIHAMAKTISARPAWVPDGKWLEFVVPLEGDGVTLEGLRLRGSVLQEIPNRDVVFQVEIHRAGAGKSIRLGRVCWNPLSVHTNKKGPPGIRGLRLSTTHHHPFDLNYLPEFKRMRSGNMLVALPVNPNPADFNELLNIVSGLFNITNPGIIEPPVWQGELL
jgi:hypothetical protein